MITIFLAGIIVGILLSLLNVVLYFSKARDKVERVVVKLLASKAKIISPNNPLDEVEL